MDQGEAAVWAAGLGIAGTLAGALGGAFVQGRATRWQVQEQEAVDVRHQLREERRLACAAVLDRCDEVVETFNPVILARVLPDWEEDGNHRDLWAPANAALSALKRGVTTVAIAGPDALAGLAAALYDAVLAKANSMRTPGLEFDERTRLYAEADNAQDEARDAFVNEVREILAAPDR